MSGHPGRTPIGGRERPSAALKSVGKDKDFAAARDIRAGEQHPWVRFRAVNPVDRMTGEGRQ